MAARKKPAKKRAKKQGRKKKSARRKPARRIGGKKRATRKAPARMSGGKKKAAKKKAGKKKAGKKKGGKKKAAKKPATAHVVIITGGRAYPGTLLVARGDTVQWENRDTADYTIHFDESPFRAGHKSQDIAVVAGATTASEQVRRAKRKTGFGYDLVGSKAATPPGEPQVTIED